MAVVDAVPIEVEVVYCSRPGVADLTRLQLAPGATVQDALLASGVLDRHALALDDVRMGVWCRVCEPGTVLRERDRVELYRPLTVDPKEARRQRYKKTRRAEAP